MVEKCLEDKIQKLKHNLGELEDKISALEFDNCIGKTHPNWELINTAYQLAQINTYVSFFMDNLEHTTYKDVRKIDEYCL